MSVTLVLAVGLDLSLLTGDPRWKSSGFILMDADSIEEAVDEFRTGDFDLVLLGSCLTLKEKERLTSLIRASGSRVPLVCVADSSAGRFAFADATLENDPELLLAGLNRLKARMAKMWAGKAPVYRYAL